MIVRIWSSGIVKGRENEYLTFAGDISMPMFKEHPIKGVYILTAERKTKVVTLWNNLDDITKMENSEKYKETVNIILASGLIEGDQSVELFECQYCLIDWLAEF